MKTTSYLAAEELLARHPGRLENINAALARCHMANGQQPPAHLVNESRNKESQREN